MEGMRSEGVSGGEEIGSLGDDGVVKGITMVVSMIAIESECVGVWRSSSCRRELQVGVEDVGSTGKFETAVEVGWRAFDGGDSKALDETRSRGKENDDGREQQSGHAISVGC